MAARRGDADTYRLLYMKPGGIDGRSLHHGHCNCQSRSKYREPRRYKLTRRKWRAVACHCRVYGRTCGKPRRFKLNERRHASARRCRVNMAGRAASTRHSGSHLKGMLLCYACNTSADALLSSRCAHAWGCPCAARNFSARVWTRWSFRLSASVQRICLSAAVDTRDCCAKLGGCLA